MFSYDVSWWVAIQMSGCGGDLFTLGLCIAFVPQSLLRKIAVKVCTSKGFIVRCVKIWRKGKTFLVEKILKNKISSETVFSLQRTCCSLFLYDQYICLISLKLIHTLFQTPGIEWDLTSIALSWEPGRFSDICPWNQGKSSEKFPCLFSEKKEEVVAWRMKRFEKQERMRWYMTVRVQRHRNMRKATK